MSWPVCTPRSCSGASFGCGPGCISRPGTSLFSPWGRRSSSSFANPSSAASARPAPAPGNGGPVSIEVLVVGNEVLSGAVADTNSGAVARALLPLGLEVERVTQVGDVPEAIARAAAEAVQRARVLVVSGGLGPTPDDCTKEALAAHFGSRLELDAETLEEIRRRFAERGLVMSESNRKQALLPEGALKIPNPVGSAPGVHWRLPGCDVFLLPGVPDELRAMLDSYVVPQLQTLGGAAPLRRAVFRTVGLPESEIAQRLQPTI